MKKFTNDFIISYLRDIFNSTTLLPKSTDYVSKSGYKNPHPFSYDLVKKRFGSWYKALELAGIPFVGKRKSTPKPREEVKCDECGKLFLKLVSQIRISFKKHFCGSKCSGKYKNKYTFKNIRTSKLEKYLKEKLTEKYPTLGIKFNDRLLCDGLELDIYIPKLNMAIEIHGILHHKPIYGEDKLKDINRRDKIKQEICQKNNINLYVIKDESSYFTEKYGNEIFTRIKNIISNTIFLKIKNNSSDNNKENDACT